MIIKDSAVAMQASRDYHKSEYTHTFVGDKFAAQLEAGESAAAFAQSSREGSQAAATLDLSKDGRDAIRSVNLVNEAQPLAPQKSSDCRCDSEEDFKIKLIKLLSEMLRAAREHRRPEYDSVLKESSQTQPMETAFSGSSQTIGIVNVATDVSQSFSLQTSVSIPRQTSQWMEHVEQSHIFAEREVTTFSTQGTVTTADGRSISFGLNMEMSRSFAEMSTAAFDRVQTRQCIDPLVINLEGNPAEFSDQTFFFDLDADGKEEEISRLKDGSGLLAIDKNKDGRINDGTELFGTKSGDGFGDLAVYDSDGNHWIDEADDIWKDLKIWTMDGDGNSILMSLSDAGIGAIHLGSADTQFSANRTDNNETQGIIRRTGMYLAENGTVGTVQHVDFTA